MKASFFACFLFIFLLALSSASAFEAQGVGSFRSCDCDVIVASVLVSNPTGSIEQIGFAPLGEEGWVTLAPTSILLLPGEERSISQFINPNCKKPGMYEVGVRIAAGSDVKDIRQQISVGQCGLNESVTIPPEETPIDLTGLDTILLYSSIALTIILGAVLVFVLLGTPSEEKPVERKKDVEPLPVKRPLRYPWESSFKARSDKKVIVEERKSSFPWSFISLLLIVLVIILIIWMLTTQQQTLLESLNMSTNLTQITGI